MLYIDFAELWRLVVASSAPSNIVSVAECVYVEDVNIRRGQQEVLNKLERRC